MAKLIKVGKITDRLLVQKALKEKSEVLKNGDSSSAHTTGGFILFGGWCNLYVEGYKKAYIKFGGLGAGGMNSDGGTFQWKGSFDDIVRNSRSAMICSAGDPEFQVGSFNILIYDGHSNLIAGYSSDSASCPVGLAGGTISWS